MDRKSRHELYREFIEFVKSDSQRERRVINRRMFSVLLWCFLVPMSISIFLILMVKIRLLPVEVVRYFDWVLVGFPIAYSVYVLSFEVLNEIPSAFRQGSLSTSLRNAVKEADWRERVLSELRKWQALDGSDWRWLVASFRLDLQSLHQRTKYMTALSGAVFFLIMQGLDALDDLQPLEATIARTGFLGWIEASSSHLSQFVGLAIFLILLYISGNQTNHSLARYLDCAELLLIEAEGKREKDSLR